MVTITNGNYVASPIPNTTMLEKLRDGALYAYSITPNGGYVLHDEGRNVADLDPITREETIRFGYTAGATTCSAAYDFSPVQVTDENGVTHTAYGVREFFTRPASEVAEKIK